MWVVRSRHGYCGFVPGRAEISEHYQGRDPQHDDFECSKGQRLPVREESGDCCGQAECEVQRDYRKAVEGGSSPHDDSDRSDVEAPQPSHCL